MGGFNIRRKTIFYDIDVLSSFLYVGREDLLEANFSRIIISNITYKRITSPSCPRFIKDSLNKLVDKSFVKVEEIHIPSITFDIYCIVSDYFNDKKISKAEGASLALAIKNNGLLGCNDREIFKNCINYFGLDSINSADILFRSFKKDLISKDEASQIWDNMYKDNVLPNSSFLEFLDKME